MSVSHERGVACGDTSAVHRVSELAETVAGLGVEADQQLRAFLLLLFGEVLFSHSSSKLSACFLLFWRT